MKTARPEIIALGAGGLGLLICLIGGFFNPQAAVRAYLFAWLFALSVSLGSMSILMLQHLTGGAWGWIIRRPAEAAGMTLPLLALLFIPIALGLHLIYPWANAAEVAQHAVLRHRQPLFNTTFTIIRAAIYFACWIFFAWRLRALSLQHDRTANPYLLVRMRRLSAAGLLIYFITMSLAGMDWIASREIDWYSSTFGLLVIVGQGVAGVAFLIVILSLYRDRPPFSEMADQDIAHDLGNLLLTVIILWTYISLAQFLVIWMGNSQEDIIWYVHRAQGGWGWVGLTLVLLHFALPFVLLLFQTTKRDLRILGAIAGGVLVLRLLGVLWIVAPSSENQIPGSANWMDLFAPVGVGGVCLAFYLWLLGRKSLIPLGFCAAVEPLAYGPDEQKQPVA